MSNLQFKTLTTIYKRAEFGIDGISATLHIENSETLSALKLAFSSENHSDSGLGSLSQDPEGLTIGQTITFSVNSPRAGLGLLAKDFSDFLSKKNTCLVAPKKFYIISEKYASDDQNPPSTLEKYQKLIKFIEILKECAAYCDEAAAELVFIHDGKFRLPVKYSLEQLESIDIQAIENLITQIGNDTHKSQKLAILTKALLSITQLAPTKRRFETLLSHIQDLTSKFAHGYKLFVADFSYDKIRDKFEETKIEYSGKIHKAIGDIQNQLLTIPVASIIVATQMKPVTDVTTQIGNYALLVAAWLYSILFTILCINQHRTLTVLDAEITRQIDAMKKQYESISETFSEILSPLKSRIKQQKIFLKIAILVLLVGLAAAHIFHYKISGNQEITKPHPLIKKL